MAVILLNSKLLSKVFVHNTVENYPTICNPEEALALNVALNVGWFTNITKQRIFTLTVLIAGSSHA